MVKKQTSLRADVKSGVFGGKGSISVKGLLDAPGEMYDKGRVFSHTIVYPGSSIGYHVHNNESETYYILSGNGKFNDNGTIVDVQAGDVTFTGDGEGHGLEATGEKPIEMIALILYHNV